ncbi:MAG: hypothetical protein WC655_07550 [Candidatus Hydrogenedentales bacterium]|jgi:hypothetical protein
MSDLGVANELDVFAKEATIYEDNRNRLLASSEGEFVLIRGEEIAGTYGTVELAVDAGYNRWGNVPFFVKRIEQVDSVEQFVSNHLGL